MSTLELLSTLRKDRFHLLVNLTPSERSHTQVIRDLLFFKACGIKNLLGFIPFERKELYPLNLEGKPGPVSSEAWWRMERLRRDGLPCDPAATLATPFLYPKREEIQKVDRWLADRRTSSAKPLVGIAPGSKQPADIWPLDRFIAVGERLRETQACEMVVIGGPNERSAGEQCVSAWRTGLNAAGSFTVLESLALIHKCAFLVGLDTGTTHIAAAVGVPCVAIYSDKDNPGRWNPLGDGHILLRQRVPCGGCRLNMDPCNVPGHPCIEGILVDEVWEAVETMLKRTLAQSRPTATQIPKWPIS